MRAPDRRRRLPLHLERHRPVLDVPPHWHEGGPDALYDRLDDPATRSRIRADMVTIGRYGDTPDAEDVLLLRLKHPDNARWQGHTLAEIAADRGQDPVDTALDILASERTSVFTAFHSMSEDNLRRQLAVPWVGVVLGRPSIGTGRAESRLPHAPPGLRLLRPGPRSLHARARAADAARRRTQDVLACRLRRFGLTDRGLLEPGYAADLVVLDPDTVIDHATFAEPHQLSVGVRDVVVNGIAALRDGVPTGERPRTPPTSRPRSGLSTLSVTRGGTCRSWNRVAGVPSAAVRAIRAFGRPGRRLPREVRVLVRRLLESAVSRSSERVGTATRRSSWRTGTSPTCSSWTPRCPRWTASRRSRPSWPSPPRRGWSCSPASKSPVSPSGPVSSEPRTCGEVDPLEDLPPARLMAALRRPREPVRPRCRRWPRGGRAAADRSRPGRLRAGTGRADRARAAVPRPVRPGRDRDGHADLERHDRPRQPRPRRAHGLHPRGPGRRRLRAAVGRRR